MSKSIAAKLTPKAVVIALISVVWIVFQLYLALVKPLHPMVQTPMHLMFAMSVVFLYHPLAEKTGKRWTHAVDAVIYAGLIFLTYYFLSQAGRLTTRVAYVSPVEKIDVVAMVVIIVILLECVRRVLGNILLFFILFFIAYMCFGQYFPGFFRFGGTTLRKFTELMVMGSSGILGTPLYTSVSSLFYFIVFGAFFSVCGGGQLLLDFGMKFSKNSSGGPAKAAVISSGLMGMISGSAVANVSTTGVMTIPMMKKIGYEPEQAGAIEAVASTGGQIMPPIMGVGAFIMAEMLGVPYGNIAVAAIIPAVAYFMSVFLLVSFLAKSKAMTTESVELEVKTEPLLPRLYLLIPAVVLVYFMVQGASLMRSGMMGIFAVIVINVVSRFVQGGKNYADLNTLWKTALQGCRQAADIAIPTGACGIIIGSVIQSGLATKISGLIASLGMTNLVFALIIAMLGCMLLGMALPTVAAYLVSVILFVPTLTSLGIAALPANMFVFYFGIMAQITPPVCLASFTAAGIAEADAWKTGWNGAKYALVAFLIPFIFIYDPGILLIGTTFEIVKATVVLFIGTYLLAAGMAGFLQVPLGRLERAILLGSAILMIVPETITDIIGVGVAVVMFTLCTMRKRKLTTAKEAVLVESEL